MPQFFHLYFLSNFNKDKFYKINESLIKTYTLNNYVKNLNNFEKILIIKEMLNEFKNGMFVIYNKDIINDNDQLIKTFEICIKDYIFLNYSSNILLIYEAKENLKNKMILISSKNILSQLNININIDSLSQFIENYIRENLISNSHNNDISFNNTIISNNTNNTNNITNTNIQINYNNILRERIYNSRFFNKLVNKLKYFNNIIINQYPIIINILAFNIFLFRLYISYKFIVFMYNETLLYFNK